MNEPVAISAVSDDSDVLDASFTVAICTLDRLRLVRETIEVARAQIEPFLEGRLLAVDNGSTDGTLEYLRGLAAQDSRLTVIHTPLTGLYHARVAAIAAATGDFIVFLDDDAVPDAGWLLGILRPLVREPKVGVSGCVARARWFCPRPEWFPDRFLDEFVPIRKSGSRLRCRFPSYPPGLALAVRRHPCLDLFAHPRRFAVALGRRSTDDTKPIYSGEDTDLCELYARNGFDVIVDDGPGVAHAIHPERLTPEWFIRRFRSEGHGRVRLSRLFGRPVLSRRNWRLFAAWPVLAALRFGSPILSAQRRMLVLAYYEKSTGAWLEAVTGVREEPLPFQIGV